MVLKTSIDAVHELRGFLFPCGVLLAIAVVGQTVGRCQDLDSDGARVDLVIVVAAGEYGRRATPVSLSLPETVEQRLPFVLTRLDDGAAVKSQIDDEGRLWWLLADELAAGKTRRYRLAANSREATGADSSQPDRVTCQDDGKRLVLQVGGQTVLHYNHAVVPSPDPAEHYYRRSGYLHPVLSPSGKQITDDFAPDHPHQHGVMFAWTNTTYEGRDINFWDQKDGNAIVEHVSTEQSYSGPAFGGFSTVIRHSDLSAPGGAKPVLSETWDVRAFGVQGGFLFDLQSVQTIMGASPLRINEYHYGSNMVRGNRIWLEPGSGDFLTSEGKTRADGNHTRARWCDLHGTMDGEVCGITVFSHPDNFRAPQPVRLHPQKPYFCFAPMVLGEFEIRPGEPYQSRFRYFVHDGPLDPADAERMWNDYANPPVVRLVVESSE